MDIKCSITWRALVLCKSYRAVMNKIFMYARPCSIKWRQQFHFSCKISVEFSARSFCLSFGMWRLLWAIQTLLRAFDYCLTKMFTSTWVFWLCLSPFSLSIFTLFGYVVSVSARVKRARFLSFLNFLFSSIRRSEFFIDNFRDQVKRFRSTVA